MLKVELRGGCLGAVRVLGLVVSDTVVRGMRVRLLAVFRGGGGHAKLQGVSPGIVLQSIIR